MTAHASFGLTIEPRTVPRSALRTWDGWIRRALAVAVFVLVAALAPTQALADTGATLYVDQHNPSCSNAGTGTSAQPFCSISAAAAKTAPGTTVLISSGTYAEVVRPPVSGTPGNPITYMAAPGANVTLSRPSGSAFYVAGQSWITLQGVSVIGSASANVAAIEVTVSGATAPSNVAIVGNRVTGAISIDAGSQVSVTGNRADRIHLGAAGADVEGNTVGAIALYNTGQSRVAGNSVGDGAVYLYAAHDDTLEGNVIHTTRKGIDSEYSTNIRIVSNAVVVYPSFAPNSTYAINILSGTGNQLLSNSVAQFTPYDAVALQGNADAVLADNVIDAYNTVAGAAVRVCKGCQTATTMDFDVLDSAHGQAVSWNGSNYDSLASLASATGQEVHGIHASAGFADPANGDLSLTPGSPAVDSALSGTLTTPAGSVALPAQDARGGARVDDAATANSGVGTITYADRGAYEMRNPGFEANSAGWNASGSSAGVALSRVAGGHTGTGAALLTNAGTTSATCALNDSPNIVYRTTGGTYTATVWVRSDQPGATLKLRLREYVGSAAVGAASSQVTLTGAWQPVRVRYAAADPGASTLDFTAYVLNAPPGTCFYADDASVAVDITAPPPAAPSNRVTAPSGGPDDGFGGSVAVAGDTMVVGDPFATVGGHVAQGAVYVFGNVGGVWVQQAKLTASDGAAYSDFGYSVAISGSTVVVGAPTAYVNGHFKQGAVYVYAGTAGAWTQQAKLTAPDGFANDQLGYAVALSGTTLLAGAAACPTDVTPEWTSVNSLAGGRAYVYTESGGVWTQQTKLSDPYGGCLRSVGVSGNTAVIGINSRGGEVFTESDGAWTPQTTLAPSDLVGYSAIGRAVAISGDTVALGVPGAAYVFSRSAGVWTQQAKLTAADGSPSLGISVAISDGTLVAGAPGATVTDGTSPGAAYVFSNAGGTWTQQSRLTAADGAARDEFGYSVAVSGGTVATGAPLANSLQGSAYVFGGF